MINKKIFWSKQNKTDLPNNLEWLSENERKFLASLRFIDRKESWVLGRWTAKQAFAKYSKVLGFDQDFSFTDLEIVKKTNGAPSVYYQNRLVPIAISLSHRQHLAVCALAKAEYKIGIDIEKIEPRTKNFVEDYFTNLEIEKIYQNETSKQPLWANLFWSAKESVLKALEVGLSVSTHQVEIENIEMLEVNEWQSFEAIVSYKAEKLLGWWKKEEDFVITIAMLV
jgi:phosphopantetheine--protein transferase-like protein